MDVVDSGGGSDVSAIYQGARLFARRTDVTSIRTYVAICNIQHCCSALYGVTAIGDIETFDYFRLRRNFASMPCESQCKPFVVEHSLRATASVQC